VPGLAFAARWSVTGAGGMSSYHPLQYLILDSYSTGRKSLICTWSLCRSGASRHRAPTVTEALTGKLDSSYGEPHRRGCQGMAADFQQPVRPARRCDPREYCR
jgi:hypothetical protein